jgi:hypothetical protein
VLFAMFVTLFFLTQLFQLVQHRSALAAGLLIVPTSVAVIVSAGIAGKLIPVVGPRVLALAMTTGMLIGLVILTRTTESTGTGQIVAALVIFGFGSGLALPALTDTVMAAVPERDAGVGSAVNDVSRQLGGALGVAVIGSFVSSAYRAKLHHLLSGKVPAEVARTASSSIGMATQTARTLPPNVAATLTRAANHAFVSAITSGFRVSIVIVGLAFVVAATMVPRRMRTAQFGDGPGDRQRRPPSDGKPGVRPTIEGPHGGESGGTGEGDPSFTIGSQTLTDHVHITFGKQPSTNGKGIVHGDFEGQKFKGTIEITPTKGDCIINPLTQVKGVGELTLK